MNRQKGTNRMGRNRTDALAIARSIAHQIKSRDLDLNFKRVGNSRDTCTIATQAWTNVRTYTHCLLTLTGLVIEMEKMVLGNFLTGVMS